ncbi:hypothetical protein E6W39_15920 [Kitasatospora acidiphila]|uniref:Uncharacterized protein n=1 Tax=Kitasatospora acidiphila TaxID=2567942 RepID=A0A540W352_9ACTN|nr:hypothetical protein [Kitasatospora acidiphila]TQF03448.1 hypothetical protein E6W39_15920 [Kitasatospora acidiphila]
MNTAGAIVLFGAVLVCAISLGAYGVLRQRSTPGARLAGWVCLALGVPAGLVPVLALLSALFVPVYR